VERWQGNCAIDLTRKQEASARSHWGGQRVRRKGGEVEPWNQGGKEARKEFREEERVEANKDGGQFDKLMDRHACTMNKWKEIEKKS